MWTTNITSLTRASSLVRIHGGSVRTQYPSQMCGNWMVAKVKFHRTMKLLALWLSSRFQRCSCFVYDGRRSCQVFASILITKATLIRPLADSESGRSTVAQTGCGWRLQLWRQDSCLWCCSAGSDGEQQNFQKHSILHSSTQRRQERTLHICLA